MRSEETTSWEGQKGEEVTLARTARPGAQDPEWGGCRAAGAPAAPCWGGGWVWGCGRGGREVTLMPAASLDIGRSLRTVDQGAVVNPVVTSDPPVRTAG